MRIDLQTPITIAGRTVAAIDLRAPGRRVAQLMAADRLPTGFTVAAAIRFGARLSGHGEATIRRLAEADLEALRLALESIYKAERRRYAARSAIEKQAWEQRKEQIIREVASDA